MALDLKELQKALAKQKVYDAWQYVESLNETLSYMNVSYELIEKVYNHRLKTFSKIEDEFIKTARAEGKASLRKDALDETDLIIAGLNIDSSMFLSKTILEFFHYARTSMEILFQIINAALFGDSAIDVNERNFPNKISRVLDRNLIFQDLNNLLRNNKNNNSFKYLQGFDNYIKHIKTILITIKNSILFDNANEFLINEFLYNGILYPSENAINKVFEIKNYVMQTIESVLLEVQKQIPNCLDNSKRIQTLSYRIIGKELEKGFSIDYISFFIDVDDNISELPTEIKVYPLIIKPNNEIYSYNFKFNTIFIKKRGCGEQSILGYAKLKNVSPTNEFYQVFDIFPCVISEYHKYILDFKKNYSNIHLDFRAMEGEILFNKD